MKISAEPQSRIELTLRPARHKARALRSEDASRCELRMIRRLDGANLFPYVYFFALRLAVGLNRGAYSCS